MNYERTTVVIIGAGLAGLCAATILAENGVAVTILAERAAPRERRSSLSRRTAEVLRAIGVPTSAIHYGRPDRLLWTRAARAGARLWRYDRLLGVGVDGRRVAVLAAGPRGGLHLYGRYLVATDRRWPVGGHPVGHRIGSAFLAGDAADPAGSPPDRGVQDVHNLCWKLAAVARGYAGHALLDSYEAERHAAAERGATAERGAAAERGGAAGPGGAAVLPGMDPPVGAGVAQHDLTGDDLTGDDLTGDDLTGQAGTRAPRLPLRRDGREICARDLFGPAFTLLAGPDAGDWSEATRRAAKLLDVPVDVYRVGADVLDPYGQWDRTYGVGRAGASLVRPDGVVGWRTESADGRPDRAMEYILTRILCR
jgi:hypothetical protein